MMGLKRKNLIRNRHAARRRQDRQFCPAYPSRWSPGIGFFNSLDLSFGAPWPAYAGCDGRRISRLLQPW